MKSILLVYLIIFMSTLTGCSSKLMDAKIPNIGDLPFIHRINIQQGNVITQDMLAQLEPEMEKKKVLFIMGTSVIEDTFNSRQWDYIYTYQIGGGEYVKRRITLHFDEKELLHSITGDVGLSDSPLVAKIHKDTKVSVPRYKDKPWKQRMKEKLPFVKEVAITEEASEEETKAYSKELKTIQDERRRAASHLEEGIQPGPGLKPLKSSPQPENEKEAADG